MDFISLYKDATCNESRKIPSANYKAQKLNVHLMRGKINKNTLLFYWEMPLIGFYGSKKKSDMEVTLSKAWAYSTFILMFLYHTSSP